MLDLLVIVLLLFGTVSDPGWNYTSPTGKAVMDDGRRFELPVVSGLEPRIHGSFFAGSLDVDLDLTNASEAPVEVDTAGLVVSDSADNHLRLRVARRVSCGGKMSSTVCTLATEQTCRLSATFNANPFDSGIGALLGWRNPTLEELSVTLAPPPRAAGREIDFSTTLVWDD